MASIAVSAEDKTLSFLLSAFKDLSITRKPASDPVSQLTLDNNDTVSSPNIIAGYLATLIPTFKQQSYTELELAEIDQWLTLSAGELTPDVLDNLNNNLKFRTTLLGEKLSIADVVVYARVKDTVSKWSDEERTGENGRRHVVRWVDFVQNSPQLGLSIKEEEKVKIDAAKVLFYPKPEEAPKKEKKPAATAAGAVAETVKDGAKKVKEGAQNAAAATAGAAGGKQKKEKKEKPKREPAPPKPEPIISPSQLDLRVGHILHCRPHPNADSLFVSTIAMGDAADAAVVTPASELASVLPAEITAKYNPLPPCRTVCSGLNGLVPIEEMQNRRVVVVANLKPVTMRGIKSAAMVLAASPPPPPDAVDGHKKEVIELVSPPANTETGEKLWFESYSGTPEVQLNPKKKVWEQIQPGFLTTADLEVAFDRSKAGWTGEEGGKGKAKGQDLGKLVSKSGGVATVPTLKGANCS